MSKPKVFTVTRLLGIYPFNDHGRFSKSWAVYSVCLLTCFMLGVLYGYMKFLIENFKYTPAELLGEYLEIICLSLIPSLHLFILIMKRHKFHYIHKFCRKSSNVNNHFNKHLLFIPLPRFISLMILLTWQFGTDLVLPIFYLVSYQIIMFIIIQFAAIMEITKHEFKQLGDLNIKKHSELISFSKDVNSLYGLQLIAILCFILWDATVRANEVILLFTIDMKQAPTNAIAKILFCILAFSLCMLHLLYLGRACTSTSKTADGFNQKLFLLMRDNENLCRNRKLFTYVTLQPTVEFTALRYFQLGYPMIGSMVSCIATYLIMFIQFHDLNNQRLTCTVTKQ